MNEHVAKNLQLKETANRILSESDLISMLSKYGRAEVAGSYSYDLMTTGDIDITVFVDELNKKQAMAAFNELAHQNYFRSFKLDNFVDFPDANFPNFPSGYYLGLQTADRTWKIDIWFIIDNSKAVETYSNRLLSLDDETRDTILLLKNYKLEKNYRFSSTVIYDAVLDHGIKDTDGLEQYLKAAKPHKFSV
jgi:hypothetical protein